MKLLCTLITLHWKVLRSLNLHHSAPLEMHFPIVSLFAKIKISRFWLKTMDYSPLCRSQSSPPLYMKLLVCVCVCVCAYLMGSEATLVAE